MTTSKYFWFLIIANVQLSPSLQIVELILLSAVSIQFPYIITTIRTPRALFCSTEINAKMQFSSMAMGTKLGLNLCYLLEREAGKWGLAAPGFSPWGDAAQLLRSSAWCHNDESISKEMVLETACLRIPSKCFKKTNELSSPALSCLMYLDIILSLCLRNFFFFNFLPSKKL